MNLFEEAFGGQLANYDVVHEMLNFVILLFNFVAYASLMQKLRHEKSAAMHVSLQMMFAFVFTEINRVVLSVIGYYGRFSFSLRSAQMFCRCITCIMSIIAYRSALRHVKIVEWDNFGEIIPRKKNRETSKKCCGFRLHWLTLYILALAGGFLLQYSRRGSVIPMWYGLYECFVDMVGAIQLLPQLHLVWIRKKRISIAIARFAVFMLTAKFVSLLYWLSDVFFHGAIAGRGIHIVSDFLNVLILVYFAIRFVSRRGLQNVCLPV